MIAIDTDARTVTVRDLDAAGRRRDGRAVRPARRSRPARRRCARRIPGIDAAGVYGVQTLEDGIALRPRSIDETTPKRAVVVGAGYIGIEMAEALLRRGVDGDRDLRRSRRR